jgi:hypothetical protein
VVADEPDDPGRARNAVGVGERHRHEAGLDGRRKLERLLRLALGGRLDREGGGLGGGALGVVVVAATGQQRAAAERERSRGRACDQEHPCVHRQSFRGFEGASL